MFLKKGKLQNFKNEHITTTYRSVKTFNEPQFLQDLDADMEPFKKLMSDSDINEDCTAWYLAIKRLLDHHAPLKTIKVKSKRLPEWFNEAILETRKLRDRNKQIGYWSEYKRYRKKLNTKSKKATFYRLSFKFKR